MSEISVDLKDVLGSDSVVHHAEIVYNPVGISVILFQHGEEVSIGNIQIENHNGNLMLYVHTNGVDEEPALIHNLSDDHTDNEDGICVDED